MRFASAFLVVCMVLPAPARAQDARQLYDLFRGEMDRQMERQRRRQMHREYQQNQQQQDQQHQQRYEQDWNAFLAQWKLCFEEKQVAACDTALTFYNLADNDRPRLLEQRQTILNDATRRETEAAERERQARWAAEAAARRAEEERRAQDMARRRAEEARQARELAERHAQELARQRADAERRTRELAERRAEEERRARELTVRRAEERRLAELRSFTSALDDCRRFVIASCDVALRSSLASSDDRARAQQWREIALDFDTDREACRLGTSAACDRALSSPVLSDQTRPVLEAWRRAASPWYRATSYVQDISTRSTAAVIALPASTLVTGGIATVLAAVIAFMARPRPNTGDSAPAKAARPPRWRWLRRKARRAMLAGRIWWRNRQRRVSNPPAPTPEKLVPKPVSVVALAALVPRDPETALAALELANAYLTEAQERVDRITSHPTAATEMLNSLSLASKQLAEAERADPSATLPLDLDTGRSQTFTLSELKAHALYLEAIARSLEKPHQAVAILTQAAALDPENDRIPYAEGLLRSDLMQKRAAIAAFERALALAPRNLEYRKELVRAQSISGAEIAYDRAAKGVRTTVNVARWSMALFWLALLGSCTTSLYQMSAATTEQQKNDAMLTFAGIWAFLIVLGLCRRGLLRMKLWVRENSW